MSAPESQGALVGAVLEGAYQITRLIGEGGMGAVYEAVQLRLNKRVAVKVMARELAADREALARFHREAQITSHLGHPHLVNVVDFGAAESGEPYLVMEYLDGEDLEHRIKRVGRLPVEAAVHVTRQMASALSAAHGQGIVHRDLKPANVFLLQVAGEQDFVKILDFGISKVKAAGTKLTRPRAVLGTPNYMSPEQATGMVDEIDHRTDQWAVGCIVWEMLSGRSPFVGEDVSTLLYQIIKLAPQPLGKRVPNLPPGVELVLRRALSKKVTDRYPSITDFARALEFAGLGRATEGTPAPVPVPHFAPPKGTIAHGSSLSPSVRVPPAASPGPATEPDRDTARHMTTFSQTAGELTWRFTHLASWSKRTWAIAGGAALVLAFGAMLLLRSGTAPKPMATSPAPEVTTPPPPPAPVVVPGPAPPAPVVAPAPAPPAPVVVPGPAPPAPVVVPGPAPPAPGVVPGPASPRAEPAAVEARSRRPKKWGDSFAAPEDRRAPARAATPAAPSPARPARAARPVSPQPPKAKPKRKLIQEL
jgi:serine/threonine-protein kinase